MNQPSRPRIRSKNYVIYYHHWW